MFVCIFGFVQGCAPTAQRMETPENPRFVFEWEDNFDAFDSSRWSKESHTFHNNLVQFDPANVSFQNGTMRLHLTKRKTAKKDYAGAEYRTKEKFSYGRFVVRAKFPKGSGIITSFFTFRAPAKPRWQEIDVEILGRDTSRVQFTYFWGWPPNYDAQTFDVPFRTDDGFHEYVFEWIPGQITWYVDGREMYSVNDDKVPYLEQQIMMNIWISGDEKWAGEFDEAVLPTYTEYDYVKYYSME